MITTVIFDIGNVLTGFGWREFVKNFGYSEEICRRIGAATILSDDWCEYDRGVLTEDEIMGRFYENDPEMKPYIDETFKDWKGILKRCDYAIPWIQEVKDKGYRVLFLSNFSDRAYRECIDALDFLPYMDGGVFSYKVKMIKPDVSIFLYILHAYDLKAEECVFLDDTLPNVETAKSLGMHTIHVTDYESAHAKLCEILD